MPPQSEASVITVACYPDDYSASHLARAVEDSDAHLLNLNVTDLRLDDGRITISLRTNRRESTSTIRSLERYGYEVLDNSTARQPDNSENSENLDNSDNFDNTLRLRAAELLHIINI